MKRKYCEAALKRRSRLHAAKPRFCGEAAWGAHAQHVRDRGWGPLNTRIVSVLRRQQAKLEICVKPLKGDDLNRDPEGRKVVKSRFIRNKPPGGTPSGGRMGTCKIESFDSFASRRWNRKHAINRLEWVVDGLGRIGSRWAA